MCDEDFYKNLQTCNLQTRTQTAGITSQVPGIRSRIPQSPYFFGGGRLKDSQISHHTDVNNKVNICKRYPLKLHFISAKRHDSFRPNKTCWTSCPPPPLFFYAPWTIIFLNALSIELGSCKTGVWLSKYSATGHRDSSKVFLNGPCVAMPWMHLLFMANWKCADHTIASEPDDTIRQNCL